MSVGVLLVVGALGGLGAIGRFLLDGAVSARIAGSFPFGTLVVMLSGLSPKKRASDLRVK